MTPPSPRAGGPFTWDTVTLDRFEPSEHTARYHYKPLHLLLGAIQEQRKEKIVVKSLDTDLPDVVHELTTVCRSYLAQQRRLLPVEHAGRFERQPDGQLVYALPLGAGVDEARFVVDLNAVPAPNQVLRCAIVLVRGEPQLVMGLGASAKLADISLNFQLVQLVKQEVGVEAIIQMIEHVRQGQHGAATQQPRRKPKRKPRR